jgi:IgA Peptidase M64
VGWSDGTEVGMTQVFNAGPREQRYNLVVLAEGFRQSELGTFAARVQEFCDALFSTKPFDEFRDAVNVYRIDVASTESGADDPAACGGSGATPRTYFDARFCANNQHRRSLRVDEFIVVDVVRRWLPQWHGALVVVNSSIQGGTGWFFPTVSTPAGWTRDATHELGHYFGLADEYEFSAGCASDPPGSQDNFVGVEPDAPNVTAGRTRGTIKWSAFLAPSTAIPTSTNADCTKCDPQPNPARDITVGAFEGARYFHCGLLRPQYDCRMRDNRFPFCAVCRMRLRSWLQPFVPARAEKNWQHIGHANAVVAMAAANGALGPQGKLFCATSQNRLWMRDPVPTNVNWQEVGHANSVAGMAAVMDAGGVVRLYCATADGQLWRRNAEPLVDTNWTPIGHAVDVVGMTATTQALFCATRDGRLWMRSFAVGAGINWEEIGHAGGVVAMAALGDRLFCATRTNRLWMRDAVAAHLNWQDIGHANGVVGMAALNDKLFCATRDNRLWIRDPLY